MFFIFCVGIVVSAGDDHVNMGEPIRRKLRLEIRQRLQRQREILLALEPVDGEEEGLEGGKEVADRRVGGVEEVVEDERGIENLGVEGSQLGKSLPRRKKTTELSVSVKSERSRAEQRVFML